MSVPSFRRLLTPGVAALAFACGGDSVAFNASPVIKPPEPIVPTKAVYAGQPRNIEMREESHD